MTRVAVITVAHGRHDHALAQQESLHRASRLPDDFVLVAIDDPSLGYVCSRGPMPPQTVHMPSHELGLPVAAARNRGAREALDRGAEVLIFLDVDCLVGVDLIAAYRAAAANYPETVWSGPVTYLSPAPAQGYELRRLPRLDDPHPARPAPAPGVRLRGADPNLFWSLSFALHRSAWEAAGGFCEDYVGYGGEDTDFAQRLVAAGLDLGWEGGARAYHQHHEVESPPVRHLHDIVRNARLFHTKWARWPMLGWLEQFESRGLITWGPDGPAVVAD